MIKTNSISLLFLFLLFITTACQENQESTPLETQVLAKKSFLKGTLEDGNIKSISYDEEAININEDGTFSFETELKYATLGYLTVNGDQNEVFLSPGKTTSLSITKDGLQFSGDLETENGQLMSDKKINAKLGSYLENNWYSIHTKPEEEFLTIIDSVKGLFLSSMEKTNAEHGLSEEFMATNQASLNYSFDRMILRYPEWYKRFTGQDIQLSEQALSSIQSKTDAPQFQSLDSYEKYVRTYWDKEIQKRFAQQKDTSIYFGKQKTDIALQMINEQFKNKEAIDYWTFEFIKNHIDSYTWVNGKVYLDDFMANCTTPAVCNEAKDFEQELLAEREGHDIQIYKSPKGYQLEAHIFKPENFNASNTYAALAAFHGGGWVQGHASWTFESAKHAAENGLIGIAVEYRLSNYEDVTPQEAMQDTRDAIQWIRANAANLSIDSNKIIG
ncbi:MAG: alpha/beta hydrolase, partial [Bacteroidota bacterium]